MTERRSVVHWMEDRGDQGRRITKGQGEAFQSDGYVHYLDDDDGFTDVYICHTYKFVNFK